MSDAVSVVKDAMSMVESTLVGAAPTHAIPRSLAQVQMALEKKISWDQTVVKTFIPNERDSPPKLNPPEVDELLNLKKLIARREKKKEIDAFSLARAMNISEETFRNMTDNLTSLILRKEYRWYYSTSS